MDTTVGSPRSVTTPQRSTQPQPKSVPVDTQAATPEKVETPQAVPAADRSEKATLRQSAPNSALTTYKDQESGRLIVRVFDKESGDVLVEFPPEKAFRAATEVLEKTVERAMKHTKG